MAPDKSSMYRLWVEGSDDAHSIIHLLKRHGYDWDATPTAPYVAGQGGQGGIDSLLEALPASLKTHKRVGIVVDADLDFGNRWNRVRGVLAKSGVQVPVALDAQGLVISKADIGPRLERLGIWVMPDNCSVGVLEDFLCCLIPPSDTCWPYAKATTQEAVESHGASLQRKDLVKGQIYTWLAWQQRPGLPFGTAIAACTLGHDSKEAVAFVDWFRRLFGA